MTDLLHGINKSAFTSACESFLAGLTDAQLEHIGDYGAVFLVGVTVHDEYCFKLSLGDPNDRAIHQSARWSMIPRFAAFAELGCEGVPGEECTPKDVRKLLTGWLEAELCHGLESALG